MTARASWSPLIVSGGWNPALRKAFDGRSGAYAIRAKGGGVQYVGESHTDRGWKTLTRHFQDASGKFAKVRETFVRSNAGDYEASLWIAPKGQKPLDLQAELIERFTKEGHELVNRDDGKAAAPRSRKSKPAADDDFPFGANVNPGGKKVHYASPPHGRIACASRHTRSIGCLSEGSLDEFMATPAAERCSRCERTAQKQLEMRAKKAARGGVQNPSSAVVLGALVSLKYMQGRHVVAVLFSKSRGNVLLAYVPATSRLVIVYRPIIKGRASTKGRIEYAKTHWGKLGKGDRLEGDVLLGSATRVGVAREITYATRKGADSEAVDYWHTFGDYGAGSLKRSFVPPAVEVGRVGGRELMRLAGGSYTVTAHGIVG